MCGIAGFHGFSNRKLLREMTKAIESRGPDDKGYYESDNIALGNRRLSIQDLSKAGHMPLSNEDGTIWITYNGEIYNFQELREQLKNHTFKSNTDTEVVVHAYEEWGTDCLSRFRGMFAFALWDENKKLLFIARDRLGIKPLYYYYDGGSRLIFASEIKAILKAPVPREINWNGIHNYLTFRFIPGETAFSDIKKLPPGHYMTLQKSLQIKQYWDVVPRQSKESEHSLTKKVSDITRDSVSMRLISDVPLGVFLSGGIDSSAVVGMMSKVSDAKIKTFSIGFGDPDFDELDYAQAVADNYSTDHREFLVKKDIIDLFPSIVWNFEEPIADPALFPTFVLAKNARKYVKVVLTGEGGDEVFAGYEHYKMLSLARNARLLPQQLLSIVPSLVRKAPPSVLDKIFRYSSALGEEGINRFSTLLKNIKNPEASYLSLVSIFDDQEKSSLYSPSTSHKISADILKDMNTYFRGGNIVNAVSYYELKTSLVDHLLMKVDKMTMAHSLEARVPLLDHELVELGFQIPPRLRLKGTKDKYIFRNAMKPVLPDKVFKRRKQRFFVPINKWLEKDMDWLASGLLSQKVIERRGYLNHAPIRRIFQKFNTSKLYYSRQLWSLLALEIWFRLYKDGIKENRVMKDI